MSDRGGVESVSASEMLAYLLTLHPYCRQIAALPDNQIERLRGLLKQAAAMGIGEEAVYDALTRGFQNVEEQTWSSPPLAYELQDDGRRQRQDDALLKVSA
jgi:hypothetical protein